MNAYVYETAIDLGTSSEVLTNVRRLVREIRACHPELSQCPLVDMGIRRQQSGLRVTLHFKTNN